MANRVILASFLLNVFCCVNISFGMESAPAVKGSLVKVFANAVVSKAFMGKKDAESALPEDFAHVYLPLVHKENWNGYKGYLQICADTNSYPECHLKFPASLLSQCKDNVQIESMLLLQQNPPRATIQSMDEATVIDLEEHDANNLRSFLWSINRQTPNLMHVVVKLTNASSDKEEYQIHKIKALTHVIPNQIRKDEGAGIDSGFEDVRLDLEQGRRTFWGWQLDADTIYIRQMRNRILQMGNRFPVASGVLNQLQCLFDKKDQFILSLTEDGTPINMCITTVSSGSYFYSLSETEIMETISVVIDRRDKKNVEQKGWLSPKNFAQFIGLLILAGVTFRACQTNFSVDAFFG